MPKASKSKQKFVAFMFFWLFFVFGGYKRKNYWAKNTMPLGKRTCRESTRVGIPNATPRVAPVIAISQLHARARIE